jgi:hypothetical protein
LEPRLKSTVHRGIIRYNVCPICHRKYKVAMGASTLKSVAGKKVLVHNYWPMDQCGAHMGLSMKHK